MCTRDCMRVCEVNNKDMYDKEMKDSLHGI